MSVTLKIIYFLEEVNYSFWGKKTTLQSPTGPAMISGLLFYIGLHCSRMAILKLFGVLQDTKYIPSLPFFQIRT